MEKIKGLKRKMGDSQSEETCVKRTKIEVEIKNVNSVGQWKPLTENRYRADRPSENEILECLESKAEGSVVEQVCEAKMDQCPDSYDLQKPKKELFVHKTIFDNLDQGPNLRKFCEVTPRGKRHTRLELTSRIKENWKLGTKCKEIFDQKTKVGGKQVEELESDCMGDIRS